DYSYLTLDFDGVGGGVEAEDLDAAGGGCQETGEHFDGCGFSCSVGAEESEELARRDGEVDVLNGGEVAETAGEACSGDGRDHVGEAYRMDESGAVKRRNGDRRDKADKRKRWPGARRLSGCVL